jgi:hypothetical protein
MPIQWKKVWIADETFESAGVFDVNNDGRLDIVSGAFWYEGPEFRKKHFIGPAHADGEYYDDFSTIPLDVNGDGRLDIITGGWFRKTLYWLENPGDLAKTWPEHAIAEVGNIETTRAYDIDGDGVLEILPNTPPNPEVAFFKLIVDKQGKGTGAFRKVVPHVFPAPQGHGMGCGDIAGHGRMDIVLSHGWLESPPDPLAGSWTWHPEFDLGCASVPILVADVNGDGCNDLIVGQGHGYGLDWWEQRREKGGRRWVKHPIDPFNAQYHDMQWADIDGDGKPELITGKRHRAHAGNDAGEWDDRGIYYFKWNGESFAKQVMDYGPAGRGKGCGIFFQLADLRGSGRLDLIAPGKDGLYVYFNEGMG